MSVVYGDLLASGKFQVAEFKRDHTRSLEGEPIGRPKIAPVTDNITEVHQTVICNCRIELGGIAVFAHTSKERVYPMLTEYSGMKKLTVCWMLRLLTHENNVPT